MRDDHIRSLCRGILEPHQSADVLLSPQLMLRRVAILSGVTATAFSALAISGSSTETSAVTDDVGRRQHALTRARVWFPPAVPISRANLSVNPIDARFRAEAIVRCRFEVKVVGGLTPKFPCTADPDEPLKVRYGRSNPEIRAELAASRLLTALGFPTDPVYSVRGVDCEGCPSFPFLALRCFRNVHAESACMPLRDAAQVRRFSPVLIERRFPGHVIENSEDQGWRWDELDAIDPKVGATRAEVDALRIMAVLLAHWDNKAENQRLICAEGAERADGSCERPTAMIADLGGSFGPLKAHLARWQTVRMWSDPKNCDVSLESLPWRGGTFPPRRITEPGRQLAIGLLSQLSARQLHALFTGAGFSYVPSWVEAFRDKVRQLQLAGPCPTD